MQDLGTLGGPYINSGARGVNDSAQVVGDSVHDGYSIAHAFLYSDGTMSDLNSLLAPASGWTLESADGINNSGDIVGFGINPAGQTHAFLLTPITPTPEPSTFVLLAAAAVGLAGYERRRRRRAV
jgi:probable HAF family extracellular repeat protein